MNTAAPANMWHPDSKTVVEATEVTMEAREYLARVLRSKFPYMPDVALNGILYKTCQSLRKGIIARDYEMTSAKERTDFFRLSEKLRKKIYELALGTDAGPQEVVVCDTPYQMAVASFHARIARHAYATAATPSAPAAPAAPATSLSIELAKEVRQSVIGPDLLRVNRAVRMETMPMHYANRTFIAYFSLAEGPETQVKVIKQWLRAIGPSYAALIKRLVLRFHATSSELKTYINDHKGARRSTSSLDSPVVSESKLDTVRRSVSRLLHSTASRLNDDDVVVVGKQSEKVLKGNVVRVMGLDGLGVYIHAFKIQYYSSLNSTGIGAVGGGSMRSWEEMSWEGL
ncbi:Hypothetical predicted protein [Lecanosticta acicola]|uniref:Uncharacterized protein n=1 Tax=Lecanosticta acicola TaxID=111012 RepID=A0AAI8YZP7_9PEZI|nr:Hypothetical predicted protein [Lecanosticta acicola]